MKARHTLAAALLLAASQLSAQPTANVVFYDGDPDTEPRPRVVAAQQVPGYTTGAGAYNGASVTVSRLDPNSLTGFGPLASLLVNQVLPPPAAQYHVGVNQLDARRAVAYFGDAGVFDPLGVEIDPPGGEYLITQQIRFFAPDASTIITYSINGGPAQVWDDTDIVHVAANSTITYRGTLGMTVGPQKGAQFVMSFPACRDTDGDRLTDRIEVLIGTNPLVAEADENKDKRDDFDEFIRGANSIQTPSSAVLFTDTDGDGWSDYDEGLRGTDENDENDFPAAANLQTVEILLLGEVFATAPGGSPPPGMPVPALPVPSEHSVALVTAGGQIVTPFTDVADSFGMRTGGLMFPMVYAAAADGSGRALVAAVPPRALCIDEMEFCAFGGSVAAWRNSYKLAYEARILHQDNDFRVDPRTTAECLLLNRYYELLSGQEYYPSATGAGPDGTLVAASAAMRNNAALFDSIRGAVTPQMVDLVSDYYRFATSPGKKPMLAQLADHFAGRAVAAEDIPSGVRVPNVDSVMIQTANYFSALPPGEELLTGTVSFDDFGALLTTGGGNYRLDNFNDTVVPGAALSVLAVVDVENCGFDPLPARITEIVSRGLAPVPPMVDTDNDGLSDDWEYFCFCNLDQDADGDFDGDGVSNIEEQQNGTNPTLADSAPFSQFALY